MFPEGNLLPPIPDEYGSINTPAPGPQMGKLCCVTSTISRALLQASPDVGLVMTHPCLSITCLASHLLPAVLECYTASYYNV